MVDVVDKATRSRMMAGIRSKDTKPEIVVRSALHKLGLRFKLHDPLIPGKPDLVFPKHSAVVFVHGCFWHQHKNCRFAYMPKQNGAFWKTKLEGNVKRDRSNIAKLRRLGWKVITVWECQVKSLDAESLAKRIRTEKWSQTKPRNRLNNG